MCELGLEHVEKEFAGLGFGIAGGVQNYLFRQISADIEVALKALEEDFDTKGMQVVRRTGGVRGP
jgi:hypothetical protein